MYAAQWMGKKSWLSWLLKGQLNKMGQAPSQKSVGRREPQAHVAQDKLFIWSETRLLVVYDLRFQDAKIYGYIGGHDRLVVETAQYRHSRTAEKCFDCPRCGMPVVAGQLICF